MIFKKTNLLNHYSIVIMIVCSFCFSGCSSFKAITNYFNSTDHFLFFNNDSRIMYEPGAEKFASTVSLKLPSAIKKVESRQYSVFPDKITIYVCKSSENFKKMTGRSVSAMTYRGSIFLSPKILDEPHTVCSYLTHELSHLLIYQKIGGYKYICIPSWFTEGLATFVSDGGGAEKVSDAEVKDAISSENHFMPIENAGLRDVFFPKYASYWGIRHQFKHHMFYRQCMLFVSFLEKEYPDQFKKFLMDLHMGKDFSGSFRLSFGADTIAKWSEFKNKIIGS